MSTLPGNPHAQHSCIVESCGSKAETCPECHRYDGHKMGCSRRTGKGMTVSLSTLDTLGGEGQ